MGNDYWRRQGREKQKEVNAKKVELEERYKALEEEKDELGPPPSDDAPASVKNAYMEKTVNLNNKVLQYQNDYQAVEKDVRTLNDQIRKQGHLPAQVEPAPEE